MKFKIGDYVKWSKVVKGILVNKRGKIIHIIDPFTSLKEILNNNEFKKNIGKNINLISNNLDEYKLYESYLILSKSREGQIPTLNWPDTESLIKIRIKEKKKEKRKIYG